MAPHKKHVNCLKYYKNKPYLKRLKKENNLSFHKQFVIASSF